jgi:hypothetical protein
MEEILGQYVRLGIVLTVLLQLYACGSSNEDSGYQIGGTVTGLTGGNLVLQNNAGDDLSITANGSFAFTSELNDGATYEVTVANQPSSQTCSVNNGSGNLSGSNIRDIQISCHLRALDLSVTVSGPKLLSFSWNDVGADYYELMKNPDGVSGYTQVGGEISATHVDEEIAVHLTDWVNASYIIQACDGTGDCNDSPATGVVQQMLDSIGYLKASNTRESSRFGYATVLSDDGSTLAIGAPNEPSPATATDANQWNGMLLSAGAVYVFTRDGETWRQQAYLKASHVSYLGVFGERLALSADGDTLVVSATGDDSDATGVDGDQLNTRAMKSGAAYVFQRFGDEWRQQAYIKASNPEDSDSFGSSLALSADGITLAVGAPWEDSDADVVDGDQTDNNASGAGAVYLFEFSDDTWRQQAYLKASNSDARDLFGCSLAMSKDGNIFAIGAKGEDSSATEINGNQGNDTFSEIYGKGAVYIFERDNNEIRQTAYLKPSNTGLGDDFGSSLALSEDGSLLAVGAPNEDSGSTGINGNQQDNSLYGSGAVYLFVNSDGMWRQEAYIKSSNPDARRGSEATADDDKWADQFGFSLDLSLDGNILAVGAIGEDSASAGINGDQNDDSFGSSGAVYLFEKGASGWAQRAYVKSPNPDRGVNYPVSCISGCGLEDTLLPGDVFGYSLSLSGDGQILAVGVPYEDSAAIGIGGDQEDNSAVNAGAVYLY